MVEEGALEVLGSIFVIVVGGFVLFELNLGTVGENLDPAATVGVSLIIAASGLFLVGGLAWNALSD